MQGRPALYDSMLWVSRALDSVALGQGGAELCHAVSDLVALDARVALDNGHGGLGEAGVSSWSSCTMRSLLSTSLPVAVNQPLSLHPSIHFVAASMLYWLSVKMSNWRPSLGQSWMARTIARSSARLLV